VLSRRVSSSVWKHLGRSFVRRDVIWQAGLNVTLTILTHSMLEISVEDVVSRFSRSIIHLQIKAVHRTKLSSLPVRGVLNGSIRINPRIGGNFKNFTLTSYRLDRYHLGLCSYDIFWTMHIEGHTERHRNSKDASRKFQRALGHPLRILQIR